MRVGCIALRDHKPGDRICTEAPLFTVNEASGGARNGGRVEGLAQTLEATVAALPTDKRTRFFALSQNESLYGTTKTAAGVVGTNGIPFVHHGAVQGGIFCACSRINPDPDRTAQPAAPVAPRAYSLIFSRARC